MTLTLEVSAAEWGPLLNGHYDHRVAVLRRSVGPN